MPMVEQDSFTIAELHFSMFLAELNELNEKMNFSWEDSGHFNI